MYAIRDLTRGARHRFVAVFASALFVACIDNTGGGGGAAPDQYFVFIESTSARVTSAQVDLRGLASCDACPESEAAFGYCPDIHGPFETSIDVVWRNLTTGESGNTFHGISGHCSCLFSYCMVSYSHAWTATVPLVMGPNVIELAALGPSIDPGTDTITITRTPVAPEGADAQGDEGTIELRWNPVDDATSYNVYWSENSVVSTATAHKVVGAVSPFEHAGLADDTTLYYAVAAVSGSIEGPLTATVWATAGWRTEVLPVTEGSWTYADTSIATDSLDRVHVHVSRSEPIGGSVRQQNYYVTNSAGAWASIPVALTTWMDADVAVDSTGVVHFSFMDVHGAAHALDAFGSWSSEVVDPLGTCGSSLALDAADNVHLAYRAGAIRYASNASGAWSVDVVDAADLTCPWGVRALSLAVEGDGTAHLAYVGVAPGYGLKYATDRGGVWAYSTIAAGHIAGLSLAVDSDGTAHAVFVDDEQRLRHARRESSGGWIGEQIDDTFSPMTPSLALDAAGNAHVSYFEPSNGGELRYATNSGGPWRVVRVAAAEYSDTGIAVDHHGSIHISYFDDGNAKYATRR